MLDFGVRVRNIDTILNVKTQQSVPVAKSRWQRHFRSPVISRDPAPWSWMGSGLRVGLKSRNVREWFSRNGTEWQSI
jgi:hypothetical protein